jgi:serine/threonine protein kinase
MDELLPNTIVSHYRILSKIGSGGMGEVYLAEDTRLDRKVALKFLSAAQAADNENLKRFTQEAKAASALNHQNILTIYEIGTFEDSPYIATEFITGKTLRDRMLSDNRLEVLETLGITTQVAAALCAAHEAGIIHRDIKPENVMIRSDGLVKVLDFGLAKLSSAVTAANLNTTLPQVNTEPGMLMGTIAYMSPEQARGQQLDHRTDIFSLGIMMFELFTGKRPFEGEGQVDLISSILKDEVPTLRQFSPALPRQLERIVDKALRKDRNQRYQHVRDLQIDIDDLRDELKLDSKASRATNRNSEMTLISPAAALTGDHRPSLTGSISTTRRFTILHAMVFALAIAAVVGAAWYFRLGMGANTPPPGSYKTTEVASWTSAAGELFSNASFSPDGKMIAFSSTRSGTKNIWVTQTGSTEAIQITNDGFSNIDPVWSAKGDEIAYFSDRGANPAGGSGQSGIWRISALGGVPRMIGTLSDGNAQLIRWTSTGKIYYQVRRDLVAMDAANGQTQTVLSLNEGDISRIWLAPDEGSIVYPVQDKDNWRILIRPIASETVSEVASGTGKVDGIAWAPEKNRLFYAASVDGVLQVFVTDIGSGRSTRITSAETDVNVVDVASDGKSILTSSAKEESNLWRVNIADKQEGPIARDLSAKFWPAVSPDNTKIAFQSVKNLSQGNYLFDSSIVVKPIKQQDDGRPLVLTEHGFLPQWSPDGTTIAYGKQTGGSRDLYLMNESGGGERRLTTNGLAGVSYSISPYNIVSSYAFTWSPDGRLIAYPSEQNGISNIWTVGVREGTSTVLTSNNDPATSLTSPIWAGDGKRVAVSFQTKGKDANDRMIRGLIVADVETRTSATVYSSNHLNRLIGWSADNNSLIIAEPSKFSGLPPDTTIKKIDIGNGAETTVANLKNVYFYNMFLADDRRSIAFAARNDGHDDIWVLPVTGGTARKITANNDSGLFYSRLAWLHDGSGITFGKQTRFSLLSIVTGIE